jgi:hypothetical protein
MKSTAFGSDAGTFPAEVALSDLLHSATIAVVGEVPIERLWHAVPSYPTLSEVWLRFLESLGRETARPRDRETATIVS